MPTRIIILPHTVPPSRIIYENHFEEVIRALGSASEKAIARVGQLCVVEAQNSGTYQNRTGNLRRMITSNSERASKDLPSAYPSHPVRVVDSDGHERTRKQYEPPGDFDKTTVVVTKERVAVRVGAIMDYAQAREAAGDQVLTAAVLKITRNGVAIIGEVVKVDLLSKRRRSQKRG